MNVTLQRLFKISFFIYFCNYDATIADLLVPNQPINTDFPETLFTNRFRSFNSDWFKRFGWLHYGIIRDAAFCFFCTKSLSKGQISTGNIESAFVKTGFWNWKKALEKDRGLLKHQQSSAHNDAVQRYVNAPVENHDVGEMTSSNITQLRRTNTNNLLKIISNIKFLGEKYYWGYKPKPHYINKLFYNNCRMFYGSLF